MARYAQLTQPPDGWTEWINPKPDDYKMACCDCGAVHDLQFKAVKIVGATPRQYEIKDVDPSKYTVIFRARRNNRATGQVRRRIRQGGKK